MKDLQVGGSHALDVEALETSALITNRPLLRRALVVLVGVILGFLVHGALHLQPATIAMTGATVLLLWGQNGPHHVLREIEWTT